MITSEHFRSLFASLVCYNKYEDISYGEDEFHILINDGDLMILVFKDLITEDQYCVRYSLKENFNRWSNAAEKKFSTMSDTLDFLYGKQTILFESIADYVSELIHENTIRTLNSMAELKHPSFEIDEQFIDFLNKKRYNIYRD